MTWHKNRGPDRFAAFFENSAVLACVVQFHGLVVVTNSTLRTFLELADEPAGLLFTDVDVRHISSLRAAGANDYLTMPLDVHQLRRNLGEFGGIHLTGVTRWTSGFSRARREH